MRRLLALLVLVGVCFGVSSADAALIDYQVCGLTNPDYDWWYGCSATSAGMMMGYYDINGYGGLTYDNLVPGGDAEAETHVGPPTGSSALVNNIIASSGHITDFYSSAPPNGSSAPHYMNSGDDLPGPFHSFDCLADFMGTSQDSVGNLNGSTNFHFYTGGSQWHDYDVENYSVEDADGMYGIGEYVAYAGYDHTNLYTQLTDNNSFGYSPFSGGFSFADYMNEIDNDRVVMLHVEGHSMYGYDYGDNNTVYLHDTWTLGQKSMSWGGAYATLGMWGVTVLEITGGDIVPEPASLAVWSLLCMIGFSYSRRRKRRAA